MLYTIIGEADIFYSELNAPPRLLQRRCKNGIITMKNGAEGPEPYSFFSTDPRDYINKSRDPLKTGFNKLK